jgi:outer membrane lipoprotein SlyB
MLDLRTGQVRSVRTRSPTIPLGPLAVAVPISIGGEKRRDVPGEEITVRLRSGGLVLVVQELSHPAFALGEEVKILHEKPNLITGESRTRVVRVE